MQVIISYEEYVDLQERSAGKQEYDKWIARIHNAKQECVKDIVKAIKPYIENNPYFSINSEQVGQQLKAAFRPLNDELEKLPKITEQVKS